MAMVNAHSEPKLQSNAKSRKSGNTTHYWMLEMKKGTLKGVNTDKKRGKVSTMKTTTR